MLNEQFYKRQQIAQLHCVSLAMTVVLKVENLKCS